jgi:N-acetylglucosaminyldiphosphoundecaprenol N-acetyl-beta-D-mannosaminyltransferase
VDDRGWVPELRSRRVHVQGIAVDALDVPHLLDQVERLVVGNAPATIGYVNAHVLNTARQDAALTRFLTQLDICYADGNSVVMAARWLGTPLPGRMTGADWIWDLCARARDSSWRLAWVGGRPGVADTAAAAIEAHHPGIFVHTEHGFQTDAAAVVRAVNASQPDIVLVGMGTPTQERWISANRPALSAQVVWAVGATADFVSGRTARGPRWLTDRHEWLARLAVEPRRLGRRYLVGNTRFVLRAGREAIRKRTG